VNDYIATKSAAEGTTLLKLHKKLQKTSIKKLGTKRNKHLKSITRYTYEKLYDGIHPGIAFKDYINARIYSAYIHCTQGSKAAERSVTYKAAT